VKSFFVIFDLGANQNEPIGIEMGMKSSFILLGEPQLMLR
jgi:hypothetical protein